MKYQELFKLPVKPKRPPSPPSARLLEMRRAYPAFCFITASNFSFTHDPSLLAPVTCKKCGQPLTNP